MAKALKRIIGTLVVLLALYSLLGFLILPGAGLRIANQQLANYATLPAHIERLEFNPFSFELTAWGLHIGEPGHEQVAFERLYANLQVDSLWTGALHLEAVELDKPRSELLFGKDGKLNLASLFKLPPAAPQPQTPSKPFPLRIGSIKLVDGYLHFKDERPSEPIEFLYNTMNLELKNLSTLPDDQADMTLVAAGPEGGQIEWSGTVGLNPIVSAGKLKLSDGQMKVWWPYVRDALPLVLENGVLNFSTDYQLDLSHDTQLHLNNAAVSIAPFALNTPDGRPLVKLERLDVTDTSLDLAKQQVTVGQIRSQKLETWAAREKDGQLDWQKLFASQPAKPSPQAAAAPATADAPTPPPAPSKPWQVLLKDVQLRDYSVHLADRMPADAVAIDLGPLNVDLKDFDSLGQSPFTLKLDTGVGKQGKVTASGSVSLKPMSAKLAVTTRDIDLRVAQAYISPFIKLELRSGMLDSDLAVDLKSTEPLALNVTGRAEVDQLHTLDTVGSQDFVKWQQLIVEGLDFRLGDSLTIAKVTLQQPYVRFMINANHTTNVDDLLIPQPVDKHAPAPVKSKPMGIRIGQVAINDGSANFADFSLTPNFATAIQQLNGQVGTLDNRQPLPAKVDIKGKVDRYAPVTIAGSLTPFDPLSSLDIATSFKGVELTTLTPYSGKFAGYRIRKGRLNLDLHYKIDKGQLVAQNKVLVEQLQLGDKVDSPDATSLPVRLAVALLKDTDGNISIELPISGNLNNPQFSVMPIVWQTLRNLVLRAAQAPFKFIAGLVAGGDNQDLGNVAFAPGSSDLSPAAQQTLGKLAAALKARPTLRLEVEGTSAQNADGPLLAQQRLAVEFQNSYYKILQRRGDKVPAQASQLQVPDNEQLPLLEAIYRTRLKQQPPEQWAKLEESQRTEQLRNAVLGTWTDDEALLRKLAQARAGSVKAWMVDQGKLSDDRVFLLDASFGPPESDGKVVTQMHLDAE
ncbi:DUF748 domain-containing protein [Pseudomonas sp. dw_358]|uniref:DUF748 domain-containing protein n=1 Tax=Pseudomonas sp. dw_358 TaxID=2720083 RepID=UPI001BD36E92|nr:DUF748 domain-containing protein [Pseudomonas sp. dw_358]